jgi:hypothetical protein
MSSPKTFPQLLHTHFAAHWSRRTGHLDSFHFLFALAAQAKAIDMTAKTANAPKSMRTLVWSVPYADRAFHMPQIKTIRLTPPRNMPIARPDSDRFSGGAAHHSPRV